MTKVWKQILHNVYLTMNVYLIWLYFEGIALHLMDEQVFFWAQDALIYGADSTVFQTRFLP